MYSDRQFYRVTLTAELITVGGKLISFVKRNAKKIIYCCLPCSFVLPYRLYATSVELLPTLHATRVTHCQFRTLPALHIASVTCCRRFICLQCCMLSVLHVASITWRQRTIFLVLMLTVLLVAGITCRGYNMLPSECTATNPGYTSIYFFCSRNHLLEFVANFCWNKAI